MVKKKKNNKKKTKKVLKNKIGDVSEKISFILDKCDVKFITKVVKILGAKEAFRLCNESLNVEKSGLEDEVTKQRLSKLGSFLYLIRNDVNLSENKKNLIFTMKSKDNEDKKPKLKKKQKRNLKNKLQSINQELNSLCLDQLNDRKNNPNTNYFAIESLNKLNEFTQNKESLENYESNIIRPSKFVLNNSNDGFTIKPNYCTNMIKTPTLNLDQFNVANLLIPKNDLSSSNNLV